MAIGGRRRQRRWRAGSVRQLRRWARCARAWTRCCRAPARPTRPPRARRLLALPTAHSRWRPPLRRASRSCRSSPPPPPTRHARASAALVPRHATSPRIVCGARRKVFLTSGWRCVRSRGRPSARRPRCRSCLPRRPNATCIATSLSTSSPGALHLQSLSHILYLTLHLK